MQELNISPDIVHLNASLAAALVDELERIYHSGIRPMTLAISGGRTPLGLLSHLVEKHSKSPVWKEIHLLWVDERHVPFDDPDSNYGNARLYIEKLGVPQENIHPMGANPDTTAAAQEYHQFLMELAKQRPEEAALCDVTLLGLGPDGHMASLFPGADHLHDETLCKAAIQPASGQARITMTLQALNSTNCCIFMALSNEKADIISRVFQAAPNPDIPATLIDPQQKPIWYLDQAAASLL